MDALTSPANVAGYKAVLLVAADNFGRFFPMLITAAGTSRPPSTRTLAGLRAKVPAVPDDRPLAGPAAARERGDSNRWLEKVRPMRTVAKAAGRRTDQTENAVFGVLMAAFMGASPFVAYAAGRWADATLSRAAQAQQAPLRQVPATLLDAVPRRRHGAREVPDTPAEWRGPDGLLRTGRVCAPAGAKAGSRVKVWINQAGDVAAPPMQQAEIANRVELAQGVAAAGFAAGLGAIGWLTRHGLDRRRAA